MKRFFLLSVVTLASFSLMGCQFFQPQQPEATPEGTSESSTATVNIRENDSATSTGTLSIEGSESTDATATGTLEITETEE